MPLVVHRLLEIVFPTRLYLGQKDYQQWRIIQSMLKQINSEIELVRCPIERAVDGLAMSSRNRRLTEEARSAAPFIYKLLKEAKKKFKNQSISAVEAWVEQQYLANKQFDLEYFEIANATTLKSVQRKRKGAKYRAFVATYAGNIRLIDNIALN